MEQGEKTNSAESSNRPRHLCSLGMHVPVGAQVSRSV